MTKTSSKKPFKWFNKFDRGTTIKTVVIGLFGLLFIIFLVIGLVNIKPLEITLDGPTVQKLRHYTQSYESRNPFAPVPVTISTNKITVELTDPYFMFTNGTSDGGSTGFTLWYARYQQPFTLENMVARGVLLGYWDWYWDDVLPYCDTPDGSGEYYTHFEYSFVIDETLMTGWTYGLYIHTYNTFSDDSWCEFVGEFFWLGGGLEIRPERTQGLSINIGETTTSATLEDFTNCPLCSFFEYLEGEEPTTTPTTTPEETTTSPTTNTTAPPGDYTDGTWNPNDQFFLNIAEQFETNPQKAWIVTVLLIAVLILLIIILVFVIKKLKEKKKGK